MGDGVHARVNLNFELIYLKGAILVLSGFCDNKWPASHAPKMKKKITLFPNFWLLLFATKNEEVTVVLIFPFFENWKDWNLFEVFEIWTLNICYATSLYVYIIYEVCTTTLHSLIYSFILNTYAGLIS